LRIKQEKIISAIEFRVNENIRVPEVRLIGPNGENVGVVSIKQALQIAREAELDLVEVSPTATPPVCRVTDFGKFIYERTKKERDARKSQTKIEVKEIRLRPKEPTSPIAVSKWTMPAAGCCRGTKSG